MSTTQDPNSQQPQSAPTRDPMPAPSIPKNVLVLTLAQPFEGSQTTFRLNKDRIVIGSVVSADVRLGGDGVSPIHAVIELAADGTKAVIYDLASDSGLRVNGNATVTETIKNGDQISIGQHTLTFSVGSLEQGLPPGLPKDKVSEVEGRKLFFNLEEDFSPLLLETDREVEQIFDYRPAQKQALEVIMSWHGTILDVEHFVQNKSVTVGTGRQSDFGIPPLLKESRYAILTRSGEEFVLNLTDQMKGVIQRNGQLQSFDSLRAASINGPQSLEIPVRSDDFAKVSIGDVDFYMSYTAAPPRLKMARFWNRDPFFLKVFLSSLATTGVLAMAMLNATVPQNIEAEKIPERIATILYQPEKYMRPRPPELEKATATEVKVESKQAEKVKIDIQPNPANTAKPVPTEMKVGQQTKPGGGKKQGQKMAKEGQGARAKGKEGKRGQAKAPADKMHQDKAARPSPQGGKGAGGGNSQVNSIGNVDFLNSGAAKMADLLAGSSEKLGKGGERLKGFGGFTTQGTGGLAISGSGKGGGGTAETTLGGLSDKGTGGGRIGTGKGAAGTGTGIVGGATRVAIRTGGPEEAVVMGSIDASAVEAALLAHRDEFRLCYEREINAEEKELAGRVSTSFVIGPDGRVTTAGVLSSTMSYKTSKGEAPVEKCVIRIIKERIQFPIPKGAGIVEVTYPFKFAPTPR